MQIDDRIADELPGPVIGDVAAAAGLEDLDALRLERFGGRDDVRAIVTGLHAERDDRRVLEQQQLIGDRARPSAARRAASAARAPSA